MSDDKQNSGPRMVQCKKLGEELPGIPFRPFPTPFGLEIYNNVSMQAWQMWLNESPRYVNTYGLDLQSEKGREFLRQQMKIFFGFEKGEAAETAWTAPESSKGGDS